MKSYVYLVCLLLCGLLALPSAQAQQPTAPAAAQDTAAAKPQRVPYPDLLLVPQDQLLMTDVQPMTFDALEPVLYYSADTLAQKDLPYYGFDHTSAFFDVSPEIMRMRAGHLTMDAYGLLAYTVQAVRQLKERTDALSARFANYDTRFTSIETQLEDLRAYLKKLYPLTEKTNIAYDKMAELERQVKELRAELDALKKP
jgi:hypothetical protein